MFRFPFNALLLGGLLTLLAVVPANAQKVVTMQPTLQTIPEGKAVLYDNKKCPPGQIARYVKRTNRQEISITCVRHPGAK